MDKRKGNNFNRRPIVKEDRHAAKSEAAALHEELVETLQDLQKAEKDKENYRKAWEAEKLYSKSLATQNQGLRKTRRRFVLLAFGVGVVAGMGALFLWIIA